MTAIRIITAAALALTLAACGASTGPITHHESSTQRRLHALMGAIATEATVGINGKTWRAVLVLPYTTQQPTCPAAELGDLAVIGSGPHAFLAACVTNGPINTWDTMTNGDR